MANKYQLQVIKKNLNPNLNGIMFTSLLNAAISYNSCLYEKRITFQESYEPSTNQLFINYIVAN